MEVFGGNVEESTNKRNVLLLLLAPEFVYFIYSWPQSAQGLGSLYLGCGSCWFLNGS